MEKKVIAFIHYPGVDPLDLIGPLKILTGLAVRAPESGLVTAVVAASLDPLETSTPARIAANATFDDVPAPYAVVVPGGDDPTLRAMGDKTLLDYLRAAAAGDAILGSVCSGALVLGAAGLLEGRRATTHWSYTWMLPKLGAEYIPQRWVEDWPVITSAGVSAGIDMALYLVARLGGEEMARRVQLANEYDPDPPFGPIDWSGVDRDASMPMVIERVKELLADSPELVARIVG